MTAIPPQTSVTNMYTYFHTWPKHRSKFIIYGARSNASMTTRLDDQKKAPDQNNGEDPVNGLESLYGPILRSVSGGEKPKAAAAKPLGLAGVRRRFERGEKLSMVTAYDFPSGRFARQAGVELVLVGDSLGNCRLGLPDTVGVTMEDMIRATTAVRRGVDAAGAATSPKPLVIGDMPFGSYLTMEDALRNAAAFRVAGADVVKLEGGSHLAPVVRALTNAGIAVMSHIGLEPQRALLQGGFRLQGTSATIHVPLLAALLRFVVEELSGAGCVLLVVEMVPEEVGTAVQASISCPVIGIGAGGKVAGQVLVCDDMLGMHGRPPSFAKMFADVGRASAMAYETYVKEVRSGQFPGDKYSRHMPAEERNGQWHRSASACQMLPLHDWSLFLGSSFGFELLHGRLLPVQRLAVNGARLAGTRGISQAATGTRIEPKRLCSNAELIDWRRQVAEQGRRDVQKLRERGATALFTPSANEMYPTGSPGGTMVVPHFVEGKSEAADRPHFFTGVATVCLKFFNLVQPDVAIFGQKDAMQCAPAIYKALCAATTAKGASPWSVRTSVREDLETQGLEVSYISVADTRFMNEKADEADLSNSVVSICCIMKEEGHRTCRLLDTVLVPAGA
eukprot:g18973.t1